MPLPHAVSDANIRPQLSDRATPSHVGLGLQLQVPAVDLPLLVREDVGVDVTGGGGVRGHVPGQLAPDVEGGARLGLAAARDAAEVVVELATIILMMRMGARMGEVVSRAEVVV